MADNYTVTAQEPTTAATPGGTFAPSMEITFATKPSGVVGKVTVPMSHYTPAEVDDVLRSAAANIEAVHKL